MNIVKRFVRSIRSKMSTRTRKRTNKKQNKSHKKSMHRGGAIYSFDLNDKIGGLPANIPLNGTQDGDCPNSPTSELGFTNYGMTRTGGGCIKKNKNKNKNNNKNKKTAKKSMKHKKSKTLSKSRR